VKNGIASELADILNSVFAQNKPRKTATPLPPAVVGQPQKGKSVDRGKKSLSLALGAQSAITGEVKVIPYSTTNTIIIKATPRDYPAVKRILSELDIIPRQVLIEILIAEVTMSDDMTLGIEYAFKGTDLGGGISKQIVGTSLGLSRAGTLATGGLTASIARDNHIATINALASSNQINILASPHIIATDGKEASIDIGDEVPLVASKIFIDSREEITIERRDTGVILKVTPHINSTGLVTLDLSLELSDAASAVVAGESDIRIFQRNAKTTMVVQDNQTIVIGGLIDEKIEEEVTKVPFLGDIPLLGLLFRSKVNSVRKTELVLLITPHVINNLEQANSVTDEFIQRLEKIKDTLSQERVHGGGV
jgi:general secretion pathway protein D